VQPSPEQVPSPASRRIPRNRGLPSAQGLARARSLPSWEIEMEYRAEAPQRAEPLLRGPFQSRPVPPEAPSFQWAVPARPDRAAEKRPLQNSPGCCAPSVSEPVLPRDNRHAASARPATPRLAPAEEEPGTSVHDPGAAHLPAGSRGRGSAHLPGPEKKGRSATKGLALSQVPAWRLPAAVVRHRSRRNGTRDYSRDRIGCSALS
jgi:hypothetical protein